MKPFDQWNEDELRVAIMQKRMTETAPDKDNNEGRPDAVWKKIATELRRRGELTKGDVAKVTGRSEDAALAILRHYNRKGLVRVIATIEGIRLWGLTDDGMKALAGMGKAA